MSRSDERSNHPYWPMEDQMEAYDAGLRAAATRMPSIESLARWLWEHDSEGAFTWESTADEWREDARELLTFLEGLSDERT